MRKELLIAACLALPLTAFAAEDRAVTRQHSKMASCEKEAITKKLTGEARRKFMSGCLSSGPMVASQQGRMKTCNQDASAKNLKGDERKRFMSECLKS